MLQETNRPKSEKFERIYINPLLTFFEPVDLAELDKILSKKRKYKYLEEYRDSGFVASDRAPRDLTIAIREYKKSFKQSKILPQNIKLFIDEIKRIQSNEKYIVFAFRPPTPTETIKLENKLAPFNESQFKSLFENAGGIWLRYSKPFISYDGSHLEKSSAEDFSKWLGKTIQLHLTERNIKL